MKTRNLLAIALLAPAPRFTAEAAAGNTGIGSEIDGQSRRLAILGLRSTRPLRSWNVALSSMDDRSGARIGVVGSRKASCAVFLASASAPSRMCLG